MCVVGNFAVLLSVYSLFVFFPGAGESGKSTFVKQMK